MRCNFWILMMCLFFQTELFSMEKFWLIKITVYRCNFQLGLLQNEIFKLVQGKTTLGIMWVAKFEPLLKLYEKFIRDIIAPHVLSYLNETTLLYQYPPTLRIQPSDKKYAFHEDHFCRFKIKKFLLQIISMWFKNIDSWGMLAGFTAMQNLGTRTARWISGFPLHLLADVGMFSFIL